MFKTTEKQRESKRIYYNSNKEKISIKNKKYYDKNKKQRCEYARSYREANKEELSMKNKKYYEEHKDYFRSYMKVYARENYHKYAEKHQIVTRDYKYLKRNGLIKKRCSLCGTTSKVEIHHIIYAKHCSKDSKVIFLCRDCHCAIHHKD